MGSPNMPSASNPLGHCAANMEAAAIQTCSRERRVIIMSNEQDRPCTAFFSAHTCRLSSQSCRPNVHFRKLRAAFRRPGSSGAPLAAHTLMPLKAARRQSRREMQQPARPAGTAAADRQLLEIVRRPIGSVQICPSVNEMLASPPDFRRIYSKCSCPRPPTGLLLL